MRSKKMKFELWILIISVMVSCSVIGTLIVRWNCGIPPSGANEEYETEYEPGVAAEL